MLEREKMRGNGFIQRLGMNCDDLITFLLMLN